MTRSTCTISISKQSEREIYCDSRCGQQLSKRNFFSNKWQNMQVVVVTISQISYLVCTFTSILADGPKIAKRLSKQIGRETSIIKKCLGDYNSLSDDLPLLGLHDVLSSHAKFWADKSLNAEDDLALSNRHELIRNFLLVKRAEEEVVLLSSDMENTITYFKEQQRVIEEEIGNLEKSLVEVADDEKLYVCGCICVLKKFSWSVSISLNKATAAAASLSASCYDQMPDESDVDEDEDDCSDFDEEF